MRQVVRHRVELADPQRRRAQRRAQEDVAALEEGRERARNLEGGELGRDVVGRGRILRVVRARQRQDSRNPGPSSRGRAAARSAAPSARYWRRRSSPSQRPDRRRAAARVPRRDGRAPRAGRDVADRGGDFGIDGVAIGRLVGEGDAQPAGIAADFLRERPLRRRRDIGARRLRPVDRVHHDGAVAHADADDMAAGKSAPAFAAIGTERIARAASASCRTRRKRRRGCGSNRRRRWHAPRAGCARRPPRPRRRTSRRRNASRFQGLRVGPNRRDSVVGIRPNSGLELLPKIATPVSRKRCASVPL